MRTLEKALSQYETGRLTATGLMLETLQFVSVRTVHPTLGLLPSDVIEVLKAVRARLPLRRPRF